MYYQNYEDYMRSVLGYQPNPQDIYENYFYQSIPGTTYRKQEERGKLSEKEKEEYYPEVYHLITPVVDKVYRSHQEPFSRILLEQMTDEVYTTVEEKTEIIFQTRDANEKEVESSNKKADVRSDRAIHREEPSRITSREARDTRQIPRRRNHLLRDFIKVLLLNSIFENQRPPRPLPPPPPPGRPPYPGYPGERPPIGIGAPPIMPRDYPEY